MIKRSWTAATNDELLEMPAHDQWMLSEECSLVDYQLTIPILVEKTLIDDDYQINVRPVWWRFIYYKYCIPRYRAFLKISNVVSYDVLDDSKIGGATMRGISIVENTVVIEGIEDVKVSAKVTSPEIAIEASDEIVDYITYSVLFSRIYFGSHGKEICREQ